MGNDPPQVPEQPPVQQNTRQSAPTQSRIQEMDQDIYMLEDLNSISLKGKKRQAFFWIDPKIFNSENQKYQSYLKKYIDIQGCSSVDGLQNNLAQIESNKKVSTICAASLNDDDYKRLQKDTRISVIYLFCQNQQRAKLLMSNFPKIKAAKFDIIELKDFLVQQEDLDQGWDPKLNLMVVTEEDTNLMNKYRINFHSLTSGNSKSKAKSDFINFSKKFYTDSINQINQFQGKYRIDLSGRQAALQTLEWLKKPGFFWQSTQTLPKITTDPKKLAYLRFPFKESHQAILKLYRSEPQPMSQVFMVLTPTQQQAMKLKTNISNFLLFTTFAKAYTQQKKAVQLVKKNPRSILVRIMMKLPPKIIQNLDFGYKVFDEGENPNVIFNIYNVFEIIQYEEQLKQMTIQYGSLAEVAYIREKQRGTRLKTQQQNLLRNYDYLQDIISRINSQATILQMSGYFQDSLEIYNQKLQIIRKSQPSQQVLDRYTIQLGDAYRINEQYKKAEQQFLSISQGKMKLIADVHLAQLYFKTKQDEKLSQVIGEIERNLPKYKQISQLDSFKAQNYIGMQLMKRGKYKQASKLFKSLAQEINKFYDFKFQGIPLVHEIYRNRAACQTKLNNFSQALSLLDSTKDWQKVCEGSKSPGLIITENLIKSVHQTRGQTNQVKQCEAEVKRLKRASTLEQNLYLSRSGVFVNLDESIINIQTSNMSNQQNLNFKNQQARPILQQSAINIDI